MNSFDFSSPIQAPKSQESDKNCNVSSFSFSCRCSSKFCTNSASSLCLIRIVMVYKLYIFLMKDILLIWSSVKGFKHSTLHELYRHFSQGKKRLCWKVVTLKVLILLTHLWFRGQSSSLEHSSRQLAVISSKTGQTGYFYLFFKKFSKRKMWTFYKMSLFQAPSVFYLLCFGLNWHMILDLVPSVDD